MFTTARPQLRYPIAIALLALGTYAQHTLLHLKSIYVVLYLLMVGMFAWEVLLGFMVMVAIFVVFKIVFMLPLGVAIALIVLAILFGGM